MKPWNINWHFGNIHIYINSTWFLFVQLDVGVQRADSKHNYKFNTQKISHVFNICICHVYLFILNEFVLF